MKSFDYFVKACEGIHARPATLIVSKAKEAVKIMEDYNTTKLGEVAKEDSLVILFKHYLTFEKEITYKDLVNEISNIYNYFKY